MSADVVNLNAEVVSHAVREKDRCVVLLDCRFDGALQHAMRDQRFADQAMGGQMYIHIRRARLRHGAQFKLQGIQCGGQRHELRVA